MNRGENVYGYGKLYKIEIKKGIFYTGRILEEDTISIRIKTIRNEELILNKSEIVRAELEDRTGDNDAGQ